MINFYNEAFLFVQVSKLKTCVQTFVLLVENINFKVLHRSFVSTKINVIFFINRDFGSVNLNLWDRACFGVDKKRRKKMFYLTMHRIQLILVFFILCTR